MRIATRLLALLAAGALSAAIACGGGGSFAPGGTDDMSASANADLTPPPPDLTPPPPDLTPPPPDLTPPPPDLTKPASSPDLAKSNGCTGPNDCGGNPCCVTVSNMMLKDISCSQKMSDCKPNFDFSGSGMTRVCVTNADCTKGVSGGLFNDCCTGSSGGLAGHICFNKALVGMTMGKITCP